MRMKIFLTSWAAGVVLVYLTASFIELDWGWLFYASSDGTFARVMFCWIVLFLIPIALTVALSEHSFGDK